MATRPEFVTIISGESRNIALRLTNADGTSYDLTGATEIKVRFRKADNAYLEKLLTTAGVAIVDALSGRLLVALTQADTLSLRLADRQDFSVVVLKGPTLTRIVNFGRALNVQREAV